MKVVGTLARSLSGMMTEVRGAHASLGERAKQLAESRKSALDMLHAVEVSRSRALQAEAETRDQNVRIQAILDGASDAIITIGTDGIIESFNRSAEKIFDYSANDVIGRNVNMLMPSPFHEEHDGYLRNYLATGVLNLIGVGREAQARRADGTVFPVYFSVSEVDLGERRLFIGIVRDITDMKQAMDQLRSANEELQRFAYVASHDQQEPLRKATAFCQLLETEYDDALDENARSYIRYAVDGALRMRNLVQNLLAYSRVETQGKPLEPTDAGEACAEALENIALAAEEAGAQLEQGPLPWVMADRAQLVRLFQNLISNAIKYRGEQPPRIEISARESDGQWEFRVLDNGIGIDPQFHERVFVIFQRLHARDEYSGSGIGLAICKRIVDRAGGRIWVESNLDEGCTFCFSLSPVDIVSPQIHGGPTHGRSAYAAKPPAN